MDEHDRTPAVHGGGGSLVPVECADEPPAADQPAGRAAVEQRGGGAFPSRRKHPRPHSPQTDRLTVEVGGALVRYGATGSGPPLVLVHGLAGSQRWWHTGVAALARRRRVYLVDLPGFGAMRGRPFALGDAPSWLGAWMEAAGVAAADVVGHSMGGLVCARLAARHPDAVRRLVLVAPVGIPTERRTLGGYAVPLAATAFRGSSPRFLATLAADAARCGVRTLWRAGRAVITADARADLAAVRAPTLLVWGERDRLVPVELARQFEVAIPDSRLVVIPRAGHVPMAEQPEAFTRAVLDFVDG